MVWDPHTSLCGRLLCVLFVGHPNGRPSAKGEDRSLDNDSVNASYMPGSILSHDPGRGRLSSIPPLFRQGSFVFGIWADVITQMSHGCP